MRQTPTSGAAAQRWYSGTMLAPPMTANARKNPPTISSVSVCNTRKASLKAVLNLPAMSVGYQPYHLFRGCATIVTGILTGSRIEVQSLFYRAVQFAPEPGPPARFRWLDSPLKKCDILRAYRYRIGRGKFGTQR